VPILDRLQARSLLVRRPSPTDGRTHALALTTAGEKALVRFAKLVRTHEKRIASGLSTAETRTSHRAAGEGAGVGAFAIVRAP
jgi:DNA-binding MarR family transcriptional regulator